MTPRGSDVITQLRQVFGVFADNLYAFEALATEFNDRLLAGEFVGGLPEGHEDIDLVKLELAIKAIQDIVNRARDEQRKAIRLARS